MVGEALRDQRGEKSRRDEPVSYTHLDVYKRQVWGWRLRLGLLHLWRLGRGSLAAFVLAAAPAAPMSLRLP